MDSPRVLVLLGTQAAWSRGTLRGFMAAARERRWTLLHYHPDSDLDWLLREWSPAAVVVGNECGTPPPERFGAASLVSVTVDRCADGIASACIDEKRVGELALEHLLERGIKNVATFRYDDSPFAVAREAAFVARARAAGIHAAPGWGDATFSVAERAERPAAMVSWLRRLPAPCGIFTCTDGWGRTVARYAREAGLRVPEGLAIVGADNDVLECELNSPPLSSVMIPWELVGRGAATLVEAALSKPAKPSVRVVVAPTGVEPRRSTDLLAIEDALVAEAVSWIRMHADRPLSVPMVARAVGGGRQRLERRFRAALDRTVQEAIRQAHVEAARRLLVTSEASLSEIAKRSGFTSASLLNAAFQREVGTSPGAYRRRVAKQFGKPDDD
jgi:LacI family transcriptional regulator